MNNQSIHLTDLGRILLGRVPWTFAIECVLRITVIYLLLVVAMRVMGKRMASQASRNELGAMVSLAAATGPAIMAPDRGLLPPMVIAVIVVGVQRLVAVAGFRSARFESVSQGDVTVLVEDGELVLPALRSVVLARERLFAHLRMEGLVNLGSVERVYLEANGSFSIVRARTPRAGLSLLPAWDAEFERAFERDAGGAQVCTSCGHVEPDPSSYGEGTCERCGARGWSRAMRAQA